MSSAWSSLAVSLVLAMTVTNAEAAPDCQLGREASLNVTVLPDGTLAVPVLFGTIEKKMVLSLQFAHSRVYGNFADSQSYPSRKAALAVQTSHGMMTKEVILPKIQIGTSTGENIHVVRVENDVQGFPDVVGWLGTDLLQNFDVELDFKNNKLNLFSPDHCPGAVVYWAKSFASVPFQTDVIGHITINMELDGQPLTVALGTVPTVAVMGMATARRLFNIMDTSPELKRLEVDPQGTPVTYSYPFKVYSYPFKALVVPGVAIYNPSIDILDTYDCDPQFHYSHGVLLKCLGGVDLVIGLSELRFLHMYIAFKEKMIYVTGADSHL